jgi:hypothetical protein
MTATLDATTTRPSDTEAADPTGQPRPVYLELDPNQLRPDPTNVRDSVKNLREPPRDFWRLQALRGWSDVRSSQGAEVPG